MKSGTVSGYNYEKAIGTFNNRDAENEIGFEMRMTAAEYSALNKFIDKLCKDVQEYAQAELAAEIRRVLPTNGDGP